jgi:hypothetical protein
MADYSFTKTGIGGVFPDNVVETSWERVEPLIKPEQVKSRHLFGIPLVSAMKDPLTGKAQVYTDDMIRDAVDRAVAIVEQDVGIDVFPNVNKEKHAFDRNEYEAFGYFRVLRRPIASIEKLSITPPSGSDIYSIPLEWVETAYMHTGQINLIPLGNSIAYGTPANVGSGGALFLNVLGNQPWIPAFWQITYTSGYPDGVIPKVVNELIGVVAAMDILSSLAATYGRSSSHSLGIDGLSQSVSTPGPQIFKVRYEELAEKSKKMIKRLKVIYGLVLFSGNV